MITEERHRIVPCTQSSLIMLGKGKTAEGYKKDSFYTSGYAGNTCITVTYSGEPSNG